MGFDAKNENSWVPNWVSYGLDYASQKADELKQEGEELYQQAAQLKNEVLQEKNRFVAQAEATARVTLEQGRKFVGELSSSAATAATQTAKQAARTFVENPDIRDATTIATVMWDHYVPPMVEGLSDPDLFPNLAYHTSMGDYLGLTTDILSIPTQGDPSFTAFGAYLLAGPDKAATAVMMNYDLPIMEIQKGDVVGIAEIAYDGLTGNYIDAAEAKLGWTAISTVAGGLFSLADFPYYAANLPKHTQELMINEADQIMTTGNGSIINLNTDDPIDETLSFGAEILDTTHGYAGIEATGHFVGNIKDILDFTNLFTFIHAGYSSYLEEDLFDGFESVYGPAWADVEKSGGEMLMHDPNLRWDVASLQVAGAVTGLVGGLLLGKAKGGAAKTTGVKPTVTTRATAPKSSPKPTLETTPPTTRPAANSLWTPEAARHGLSAITQYLNRMREQGLTLSFDQAQVLRAQAERFLKKFPDKVKAEMSGALDYVRERIAERVDLEPDLILDEGPIASEVNPTTPSETPSTAPAPQIADGAKARSFERARLSFRFREGVPFRDSSGNLYEISCGQIFNQHGQVVHLSPDQFLFEHNKPGHLIGKIDRNGKPVKFETLPPDDGFFSESRIVYDALGQPYTIRGGHPINNASGKPLLNEQRVYESPPKTATDAVAGHYVDGILYDLNTMGDRVLNQYHDHLRARGGTTPNIDTSGNTIYYDSTGRQVGFLDGTLCDATTLEPVTGDVLLYETPPAEGISQGNKWHSL